MKLADNIYHYQLCLILLNSKQCYLIDFIGDPFGYILKNNLRYLVGNESNTV
jgi:hypothetical protein